MEDHLVCFEVNGSEYSVYIAYDENYSYNPCFLCGSEPKKHDDPNSVRMFRITEMVDESNCDVGPSHSDYVSALEHLHKLFLNGKTVCDKCWERMLKRI